MLAEGSRKSGTNLRKYTASDSKIYNHNIYNRWEPEISQVNKCVYNKTKIRNVALLGNIKFLRKTSSRIVSTHKWRKRRKCVESIKIWSMTLHSTNKLYYTFRQRRIHVSILVITTKTGQSRVLSTRQQSALRSSSYNCYTTETVYGLYTIVTYINICTNQQYSIEFRLYGRLRETVKFRGSDAYNQHSKC